MRKNLVSSIVLISIITLGPIGCSETRKADPVLTAGQPEQNQEEKAKVENHRELSEKKKAEIKRALSEPLVATLDDASKIPAAQKEERSMLSGRVAERLIALGEFELADKLFDRALGLNAQNELATFYKPITTALVKLKGMPRLYKPTLQGRAAKAVATLEHLAQAPQGSALKSWIEGDTSKTPLTKSGQLAEHLRLRALPALDEMNRGLSQAMNVTDLGLVIPKSSPDCTITDKEIRCSAVASMVLVPDLTDRKVLLALSKGNADAIRLGTLFNVAKIDQLTQFIEQRNKEKQTSLVSPEVILAILNGDTSKGLKLYNSNGSEEDGFDTLQLRNDLSDLGESLSESLHSVYEAREMSEELCNNEDRIGSNALFKSLCFNVFVTDAVKTGLTLLSGQNEVLIGKEKNGALITLLMDVPTFLEKSRGQNLNAVATHDKIKDPSIMGLFPANDLPAKLDKIDRHMRLSIFHRGEALIRKASPVDTYKAIIGKPSVK